MFEIRLYCSTKCSRGTNNAGVRALLWLALNVPISKVLFEVCANWGCSLRVWVMLDIAEFLFFSLSFFFLCLAKYLNLTTMLLFSQLFMLPFHYPAAKTAY